MIINAGDHLKIIPLPSDPFQALHEAFNIKNLSVDSEKGAELTAINETEDERG
ncbi:MAG: hypothetical protein QW638_08015 [Candidatus Bathyarchaeia archaeon]